MLACCVERMCKYIFKCVLVCCFLAVAFFLSPTLFPRCGGVRLLSWCTVPLSADQYVDVFSLSEEKTQLVLNVDKQFEEVRELVCLWSVIFSVSPFPKLWICVKREGTIFTGARQPHLYYPGVDMTCRHARFSRGGKEASSSYDYSW